MDQGALFHSVVMILLVECEGDLHFLFQKRSDSVRQPGEISFPGGRVEKSDSTVEEAALRETAEEIGLAPSEVSVLGRIDSQYSPLGIIVDAVVGFTSADSIEDFNPNSDEVDYLFMVPVSWFSDNPPEKYGVVLKAHSSVQDENGETIELLPVKKLGLPERYNGSWGERCMEVLLYKWNDEVIWGITARFVYEIVLKLS